MNHRTHTRPVTLAAMVLALVLLLPMSAAADTPLTHSGVRGVHGLIDSQEDSGGHVPLHSASSSGRSWCGRPSCTPGTPAPAPRSRRSAGGSASSGHRDWASATPRRPSIVKASATDAVPAAFTARSVSFTNAPEIEYRVRVDMYWYDAHGHQIGRATHAPDWYGWVATSHGSGIEREHRSAAPSAEGPRTAGAITSAGTDPGPRRPAPSPDARGR